MSFAENLKNELIYNDIKIKELARKTDIPYTTLLSYLNKTGASPNVETGVKIAKALNVSVEYLVTGKENSCEAHIKKLYGIFNRISDELQEIIACIPKYK